MAYHTGAMPAPTPETLPPAVSISPSLVKPLALAASSALLALAAGNLLLASPFPSWGSVMPIVGLVLFGLGAPVMLLEPLLNRPLLRFTEVGIEHRGGWAIWARGMVPWEEVVAIALVTGGRDLFGRPQVTIMLSQGAPQRLHFANWQLPRAAPAQLHLAVARFAGPIRDHGILVRGITRHHSAGV